MTIAPTRHADTLIFPASLDPHAVSVVNRLLDAELEAYLVGGCVRDLLLGLIPKDFDISTEARPRQIRRLFRNSRIIGRRFKLAHVHFGDKIIEVATFRRTPEGSGEPGVQDPDLLITRDNEFGNAEQDAVRRDFTINALLYDVRSAEVIDYVGGVQDLNDRVLRTIGDPEVRFAEDPVRMLRAVKFMSRLGLSPAPDLDAAMRSSADSILRSAPPRVLEEIFKLMTCGKAAAALERFVDTGLLQRLLPEIGPYWDEHRDTLRALGEALDLVDRGQRVVSNAFLLAVLWERPWRAALEGLPADGPPAEAAAQLHALLDPAALRMSIPRRDIASIRHLFQAMLRMERGRRGRIQEFLGRPSTRDAVQLMYLLARAGCIDPDLHAQWSQLVEQAGPVQTSSQREPGSGTTRQGGRRGRRGGRRRGGRGQRGGRGSGEKKATSAPDGAESEPEVAEAGEAAGGSRRGRSARRRGGRRRKRAGAAAGSEDGAAGDEVGTAPEADDNAESTTAAKKPAKSRTPKRRRSRGVSRRSKRGESTGGGSSTETSPKRDAPSTGSRSGPQREHPEDVEDLFDW